MKTPVALFLATAAVAATLALPALSSITGDDHGPARMNQSQTPVQYASDDDDDHGEHRSLFRFFERHHHDDDDDACEHGACRGAAAPAPAGTVPPPANGLFGSGTPPRVQSN